MKIYSEVLKRFYDTVDDCIEAEASYQQELDAQQKEKEAYAEQRKARAQEIEAARDEFLAARDKYNELITEFCKDYGSYHYSIKNPESINSYFDTLFKLI